MSESLGLTFDDAPLPLATEEREELLQHEAVIAAGIESFVEVGRALLLIRDRRLYRETNFTFEAYLEDRWPQFGRQRAHQLMRAVVVVENVNHGLHSPISERQARPLATLKEPEQQVEAWELAQELADSPERVTGKIVQQAVEEVKRRHVIFTPLPMLTHAGVTPLTARSDNPTIPHFNRTNDNVEWALWTWNPVTGCLHDCEYCYARDIAVRLFPQGFTPTYHPDRLPAPRRMLVPEAASRNIGEKNVFVCSMADLFGKWVPREWIQAVLDEVIRAPQWNFLFLTKFPQRLCEFEWPANAWVGTTVDRQYRVDIAEKAFRKVTAGVKWLSCEPLLEPLKFGSLEMFDWVVVGGSSRSTQTPEFFPPEEWIRDLHAQAREAGCKWYEKTNLRPDRIREYPGAKP